MRARGAIEELARIKVFKLKWFPDHRGVPDLIVTPGALPVVKPNQSVSEAD